jgi:Flp pilus assembly protein TadD
MAPSHIELAYAALQDGNLAAAEQELRHASRNPPGDGTLMHIAGLLAARHGRLEQAVAFLGKATAVAPSNQRFQKDFLAISGQAQRPDLVARALAQAAVKDPSSASLQGELGLAQLKQGQTGEAVASLRRAIALDPSQTSAKLNLANALAIQGVDGGGLDEALALLREAVDEQPRSASILLNLGNVLRRMERLVEAEEAYRQAVAIEPVRGDVWNNLLGLLQGVGRLDDAERSAREALTHCPADPRLHRALGHVLLARGQLKEGWREYNYRFAAEARAGRLKIRPFQYPWWEGQSLQGKRVLFWAEQGLGEEIMHASVIPDALREMGSLVLECDPRLQPLFSRSFPGVQVYGRTDPPAGVESEAIGMQCALGVYAGHRRSAFAEFPQQRGYLTADPAQTDVHKLWLETLGSSLNIGISWFSDNKNIGNQKSTALLDWRGLFQTPGCNFVDLQYGDSEAERDAAERAGMKLHRAAGLDLTGDLEGLAGLIAALDLVITVSNTTAHLAGALGRDCWVLLHDAPFWHWFTKREDSPWYPSMRLFRQARRGDWPEVFTRLAAALAERRRA